MGKKFFCFAILCIACFSHLFSGQEISEVVVIGSGPAGLTSAIYTTRAGLSTSVVDGNEVGGQIALSYIVDNYPGFPTGINGIDLSQNMMDQAKRFGAQVHTGKVVEANLQKKPFELKLDDGKVIQAKTVIIATGASPRWLGLSSEQALIGKGVTSCAVCDGALYKDKEVVVIGGGDAAIEDALFLTNYAKKITVIHRRDKLRASEYMQKKAFDHPKIQFVFSSIVEEIQDPKKEKVTEVVIKNLLTGKSTKLPTDGVFIAIGHIPNTRLFKDQIELTKTGYIVTKPFSTKTSVPGVFAAGDVADEKYRQAITAAGTGCMAGLDAYHYIQGEK